MVIWTSPCSEGGLQNHLGNAVTSSMTSMNTSMDMFTNRRMLWCCQDSSATLHFEYFVFLFIRVMTMKRMDS